ncbi:MAG: ABC transporter permease, partial [Gordonibacter sp.]
MTIARKELARFFSNKASAAVAILLPGLLIFGMWSFLGAAMSGMMAPDNAKRPVVAAVNGPASIEALAASGGVDVKDEAGLPSADDMRKRIEQGDVKAFAVFPEG